MMKSTPLVLAIESSCDETSVAIVGGDKTIHSNLILSQVKDHQIYGGVVPEVAARKHLDNLDGLIARALEETGTQPSDLDAIAATAGPGLIGGLVVGVSAAKAIAAAWDLPFLAINHLEGHALTQRLVDDLDFPFLLLLVSGGHCQILCIKGVDQYQRWGTTLDDAAGEAFDKTAKLLNLSYPGGPSVERAAKQGDPSRFALPRPMVGKPNMDFSFSGLKTAVRRQKELLQDHSPLSEQDVCDLAASFQAAVGDSLADRCKRAIRQFKQDLQADCTLVVAGGVAANQNLRTRLEALAEHEDAHLKAAPLALCGDNAAMIAWAAIERIQAVMLDSQLDFAPRPRWPLDLQAPKSIYAGAAKA